MRFDILFIFFLQAGTTNPSVTVWLKDLENDSALNATQLNTPQTLHTERLISIAFEQLFVDLN